MVVQNNSVLQRNLPLFCVLCVVGVVLVVVVAGGEDHHLFMLGKGHSQTPQDIFVAAGDTELGMQWMQEYPHFNKVIMPVPF